MMKKTVLFLLLVTVLVGCMSQEVLSARGAQGKLGLVFLEKKPLEIKRVEPDYFTQGKDPETGLYIVSNENDILVYVNKYRQLPDGYEPEDLTEPNVGHYSPEGDNRRLLRKEASEALELLFEAASEEGIRLVAVSGYRSHERQAAIYASNVASKGQTHADQFSAKPGTSEHQTGLAMDVSVEGNDEVLLSQRFGETEAGMFVATHAHRFGYIIRYPEGKEEITGYNYEPWHLRYVGQEVATELYERELTLEEYFGFDYPGNER